MDNKNKIERIKYLTSRITECDNSYYNNDVSLISDAEYDDLYYELIELEKETGYILSSSPTQRVGFVIQGGLKKVEHTHPMLSLDKTKDIEDILKFNSKNRSKKNKFLLASLKEDGLTACLYYDETGMLVRAETRGNGKVGEDITENIKQVSNVPLMIKNNGVPLEVEGEIIVKKDIFNKINSSLPKKDQFAKPRNYASGSIRQLDTKITKERQLSFIAWKNLSEKVSFSNGLTELIELGFEVVPFKLFLNSHGIVEKNKKVFRLNITNQINFLKQRAEEEHHPIDGIVFTYDDVEYGLSLGNTSHHYGSSMAYKFYDDEYETTLIGIDWNVGKTGVIVPKAVFEEVEIDGSSVTASTLNNVSILKRLKLGKGDRITVSLRNMIIPKIERNLTQSDTYKIPTKCLCGAEAVIKTTDNAESLYCTNPNCRFRKLALFKQFVSKDAMDIKGISENTILALMTKNLLNSYEDFYTLKEHEKEICSIEGFGKKSFDNMVNTIEKSRNCKFSNFLVALSIPNIGKVAAQTIEDYFDTPDDFFNMLEKVSIGETKFSFTQLKDFGQIMEDSLCEWWNDNDRMSFIPVFDCMTFIPKKSNNKGKADNNSFIQDKTFVITGKFSEPRSYYEEIIKSNGGKVTGSVSKKTDYLLLEGEIGSIKYNKAVGLNIPILSEKDFMERIKNDN